MTGLLHPFPAGTPTDAALAAQRAADHARDIAEWEAREKCLCGAAVRMAGRCLYGANTAKDDPFGDERDDDEADRLEREP